MAEHLRELIALPEEPSSIPNTHIAAHMSVSPVTGDSIPMAKHQCT